MVALADLARQLLNAPIGLPCGMIAAIVGVLTFFTCFIATATNE
ncbi:hypothetical protein [Aliterella atlantica]|nr:hypothetical protein [Aliterella atlantica]